MNTMFRANHEKFLRPHLAMLSPAQVKDLHLASSEILENTGVRVDHPKARELLCEGGARTCERTNVVKIPPTLVEWAIKVAPSKVTIYDRFGKVKLRLEDYRVHFGTVIDIFYLVDPQTGTHVKCKRKHLPSIVKVADALENIDFVNPGGMIQDVPSELANLLVFKDVLMSTTKPIIFDPHSADELGQVITLCKAVMGEPDRLRQRPFVLAYFEPFSPLVHPRSMLDILFLAAKHGIPVIYTPMSIGGATAPVTLAGNLAICNAEILSGIVIAQLIQEGLPCIYGGIPGPMDMRTAVFPYGAPESALLCAALTEMAHYYRLPMFGTAGVTDAVEVNCQAASEITLNCLLSLLSGANLVHDVGMIAGGKGVSMEAMILTNEIITMLRQSLQTIDTGTDFLALDTIDSVGPGGNFLAEEHTLKYHRAIWVPEVFQRIDLEKWLDAPQRLSERLRQKVQEILTNHHSPALDERTVNQLNRIEESWWHKYKSKP